MPVRKVSNRGGNVIGCFPSMKVRRMVAFESLIELDYLYLLDYEANVEWFEEQPLTIEYYHDGKALHYTPDFHIVDTERGNVLIECKPLIFIDKEENQRKFWAAKAWCMERGWTFQVVTDQDIRTGFRLENIKLLTRYARYVVEPQTKAQIYASLSSIQGAMSVDDLAKRMTQIDFSATMAAILCMAFHHELFIPLDGAPILKNARVSLPSAQHREVYQ